MTADSKLNGGRFTKGQSGNPGGRPKVPAEVREAALAHSLKAIQTLARLMENRKAPTVALAAATALLDRAIGKPETTTALTGARGEPLFPERERPLSDLEVARRIAFILHNGMREKQGLDAAVASRALEQNASDLPSIRAASGQS